MSSKQIEFISLKETKYECVKNTWDVLLTMISECFVDQRAAAFITMDHGISMGVLEKGRLTMPVIMPLEPQYLKSARFFNQDRECYVWKSSMDDPQIFCLRIRQDERVEFETGEPEAVEARQLLWGTRLEECPQDNDWKILKEDRGIELLLHRSLLPENIKVNQSNRLCLTTYNYIDYTPVGQAGYVDCRFVSIEGERGE